MQEVGAVRTRGTGGSASFLSPPAAKAKGKMNDHCSVVFPSPKAASLPPPLVLSGKRQPGGLIHWYSSKREMMSSLGV